jgi:hypothetical protein
LLPVGVTLSPNPGCPSNQNVVRLGGGEILFITVSINVIVLVIDLDFLSFIHMGYSNARKTKYRNARNSIVSLINKGFLNTRTNLSGYSLGYSHGGDSMSTMRNYGRENANISDLFHTVKVSDQLFSIELYNC